MSEVSRVHPPIHIIDDDEGVRVLVGRVLGSVGLPCVEWDEPAAFLDSLRNNPEIGALVVDIRLSGMSGLELVRELRDRGVAAPVVFISGVNEVPVAVEAMKLGAHDFLSKPFASQTLIDTVQAAIRRHRAEAERETKAARARDLVAKLSPRERQVFLAIVDGKANKVIAADLGLSEKTVEEHRSRVMSKLTAGSVADLVKTAVLCGLCDPAASARPRA